MTFEGAAYATSGNPPSVNLQHALLGSMEEAAMWTPRFLKSYVWLAVFFVCLAVTSFQNWKGLLQSSR